PWIDDACYIARPARDFFAGTAGTAPGKVRAGLKPAPTVGRASFIRRAAADGCHCDAGAILENAPPIDDACYVTSPTREFFAGGHGARRGTGGFATRPCASPRSQRAGTGAAAQLRPRPRDRARTPQAPCPLPECYSSHRYVARDGNMRRREFLG